MTSRASIGFVAIAGTELTTNQGFASFICPDEIHNFYLAYWLLSKTETFLSQSTGTTFKEISKTALRDISFPLPPLAEQERIVTAIEEQFTRLDAGVAALKRAQVRLRRYRAAVLKAACEGQLVAQDPADEPAAALLERILAERYTRWEESERAKGKLPLRASYKAPASPDTMGLPKLPEGWVWVSLEVVGNVIDPHPSHRTPPSAVNGIPYVGMGDIDHKGKINLEAARKVSGEVLIEHKQRYTLSFGDFIFGKIGTIGKPVKLIPPFEYALSANVVLIQANIGFLKADFLYIYLASPIIERIILKEQRATTQAAFGIQRMRQMPFALPPLAEQERIVAEVERRLSVVAALEATVAASLKRAERLRQSILKRAFAGQLVAQNPEDEPAEALLERIQAARAGQTKPAGRGRRAARQEQLSLEFEQAEEVE